MAQLKARSDVQDIAIGLRVEIPDDVDLTAFCDTVSAVVRAVCRVRIVDTVAHPDPSVIFPDESDV
jgi:hypothetical protein